MNNSTKNWLLFSLIVFLLLVAIYYFFIKPQNLFEGDKNPLNDDVVTEPTDDVVIEVPDDDKIIDTNNQKLYENNELGFSANVTEAMNGFIIVNSPKVGESISSPLNISGLARGTWFFEASFPVFLIDWDGKIIAQGIATAKGDWMTTDFVPFEATLTFTIDKNTYSNKGSLILKKDNPSGLPENDDALEFPVYLSN